MKRESFSGPYSLVDLVSLQPAPRQRGRKGRSSKPAKRTKSVSELRKDVAEQIDRLIQFLDLTDSYVQTELEDDPGSNPEEVNEDGDGSPDDEPSLGWPEARINQGLGMIGGVDDLEKGAFIECRKRTQRIEREQLVVENTYRRFLSGLPIEQKTMIRSRLNEGSWVVLR
ncbi:MULTISPECIES: hypothetical protein [unclassified Afipia]|uniref:hypothetical protein n=1 Tax=unclassified Afipia TaxID=2642050 RepID=UPI0004676E6A|nr:MULTISPECIES: hypothetical protein [unclassified Afipia]MBQ8101289.1 hypothetical protein [Afipia sp.]